MVNEQAFGISICYLPIIIFIIVEILYDYSYIFKNLKYMGLQYLFFIIIAVIVNLYIRYTNLTKFLDVTNTNETKKYTDNVLNNTKNLIIFGILLFIFILISCIIYAKFTNNKIKAIIIFFIYSVISLATMTYKYEQIKYYREQNFDNKEILTFFRYFTQGINTTNTENNGKFQKVDNTVIIPGLVFGLVFGFIDNAGLISGLEALDSPFGVISKLFIGSPPVGGSKMELLHHQQKLEGTTSGLGNLFSDGLGVTLGAFFGNLAKKLFPSNNEQPLWVDMVGISLGCVLGILIPITFKNLATKEMWKNGIFSFRFIKDFIILTILLAAIISICIIIPEKAKKDIE